MAVGLTVAITTAAGVVLGGVLHAVSATAASTGSLDHLVFVERAHPHYLESSLPAERFLGIASEAGIFIESARPLAFRNHEGRLRDVVIRGVSSEELVRPGMSVEGQTPSPGAREALIGAALRGRFEGLALGGSFMVKGQPWKITGVLHSAGGLHEAEIRCERTLISQDLGSADEVSLVVVPRARPDLVKRVSEAAAGVDLASVGERDYYRSVHRDSLRVFVIGCLVVWLFFAICCWLCGSRTTDELVHAWAYGGTVLGGAAIGVAILLHARGQFWMLFATGGAYSFHPPLWVPACAALASILVASCAFVARAHRGRAWVDLLAIAALAFSWTLYGSIRELEKDAWRSLAYYSQVQIFARPPFVAAIPMAEIERIQAELGDGYPVHYWVGVDGKAKETPTVLIVYAQDVDGFDVFGPGGYHPDAATRARWRADPRAAILLGRVQQLTGWRLGQEVEVAVRGKTLPLRIVGIAPTVAGVAAPDKVVVRFEHARQALGELPVWNANVMSPRPQDEPALLRRLEALMQGSGNPLVFLPRDGILDFFFSRSDLRRVIHAAVVPAVVASLCFLWLAAGEAHRATIVRRRRSLGGAGTLKRLAIVSGSWLLRAGPAALLGSMAAFWCYHREGVRVGAWVLANTIVPLSIAVLAAAGVTGACALIAVLVATTSKPADLSDATTPSRGDESGRDR